MNVNRKWYDAANEASFKTVAAGYVFQAPNPWIFARPRYYLVNEAQKAEIALRLRRWRLLVVMSMAVIFLSMGSVVVFAMLSPATFVRLVQPAFHQLGVGSLTLLTILLMTPLAAAPFIYLIRALQPLLADAPRTNERISMREQLATTATSVSGKLLVVGLVAGLGMMGGAALGALGAFLETRWSLSLLNFLFVLVMGGALTAYFLHLVRLRAKLQHMHHSC